MPLCAVGAPQAGNGQSFVVQERLEAREILVVKEAAQDALVNAGGLVLCYDGGYLPAASIARQLQLHKQGHTGASEQKYDCLDSAKAKRTHRGACLQDWNWGPLSMPNTLRSANAITMSMKPYGCVGALPCAGRHGSAAAGAPAVAGLQKLLLLQAQLPFAAGPAWGHQSVTRH